MQSSCQGSPSDLRIVSAGWCAVKRVRNKTAGLHDSPQFHTSRSAQLSPTPARYTGPLFGWLHRHMRNVCCAVNLRGSGPAWQRTSGLLVAGLLGVSVLACGDAPKSAPPEAPFPPGSAEGRRYVKGDQDGDNDTKVGDADDVHVRSYGHQANAADMRAAESLLKSYYAAAATGDSTTVCSLTFAGLANSSNLIAAVPQDYEPTPGTPSLRGKRCMAVISILAQERHDELVADVASLVLTGMRVHRGHALALLGFNTTGERMIRLERERGTWKVDGLFDSPIV